MHITILNLDEEVITTLSDDIIVTDAAPVISAKCHEELQGLTELTFSTTADSVEAGLIREDYYAVVKVGNNYKEFIIDNITDSDSTELIKECSASLSSVELNDSLITSTLHGEKPGTIVALALQDTRWSLGNVDAAIRNGKFTEDTRFMTVLEVLNKVAEAYNCSIFYSYVIDEHKVVKRQVNLLSDKGRDTGKRFEMGKDVTSIKREVDTSLIATAILPIKKEQADGDKGETVLDLSGIDYTSPDGNGTSPKGQLFISDKRAKQNWGRLDKDGKVHDRVKLYEYTDEDVTVRSMADLAWMSLGNYTTPKVTYTADVIDLFRLLGSEYNHEKVTLGDTVTVIDNYFTVPITVKERVIEIDHDLLDPTKTVITLGDAKSSYSTDRNRVDEAMDTAVSANENAVSAIVSANGKGTNYYGTEEPKNPSTGDSWWEDQPDGGTILKKWDGTQWKINKVSADLMTGEIDATNGDVSFINVDVKSLSGAISNFIQSHWNEINTYTSVDGKGLRVQHVDGSYSMYGADGPMRYVNGTGKAYHYLVHMAGYVLNGSSVRWAQLPDEFKGKNFTVFVAFADSLQAQNAGQSINRVVCTGHPDYSNDYKNARVPLIGYKLLTDGKNISTGEVQGLLIAIC